MISSHRAISPSSSPRSSQTIIIYGLSARLMHPPLSVVDQKNQGGIPREHLSDRIQRTSQNTNISERVRIMTPTVTLCHTHQHSKRTKYVRVVHNIRTAEYAPDNVASLSMQASCTEPIHLHSPRPRLSIISVMKFSV